VTFPGHGVNNETINVTLLCYIIPWKVPYGPQLQEYMCRYQKNNFFTLISFISLMLPSSHSCQQFLYIMQQMLKNHVAAQKELNC
jgi:hypothetical protein